MAKEMKGKISMSLEKGEWNTIVHALSHKAKDPQNSKLAKKQYENLYEKLTEKLY